MGKRAERDIPVSRETVDMLRKLKKESEVGVEQREARKSVISSIAQYGFDILEGATEPTGRNINIMRLVKEDVPRDYEDITEGSNIQPVVRSAIVPELGVDPMSFSGEGISGTTELVGGITDADVDGVRTFEYSLFILFDQDDQDEASREAPFMIVKGEVKDGQVRYHRANKFNGVVSDSRELAVSQPIIESMHGALLPDAK